MKKIISLVLCLSLLMSVAQLSATADITINSDVVQAAVSQATEETEQTETTKENETETVNNSADLENKADESSPAGIKTVSNNLIKQYNGKGNDSNVFTIDAYNTYDPNATVILLDTVYTPLNNFYSAFSGQGFDYSNYADVRVEKRSGRYAVLQKHYTAKPDTGKQVDDMFLLLVKRGTDQFEYLKSDVIADWRVDTNGSIYEDLNSDYNGDTVELNLNFTINSNASAKTGDCGTISFSHLDDGVMLGESSFQIDTINPTHIDHMKHANVIAIHPYYYTKKFENNIIDFKTVIGQIGFNDSTLTLDQKLSAIRDQGFAFIRVEKRGGVFVALQKAENIGDRTALTDQNVYDFGVQNQDGFFILARPETYEYNYIRDKLYVEWDDTAGTDVLSKGDLMNINEYITPVVNGNSLLYCGTGDSYGRWYGFDYNAQTNQQSGENPKNGGPYAYFNFYINNVNGRDDNEPKNTDLEVADNTNIKFQIFKYGSGINDKLRDLGLVNYFNFRGLYEGYNYAYDDDGFTHNHASVERTLNNNLPVLNLTRRADGGTKSDTDGTLATDTYPLNYDTRANFGYLFGSTLNQNLVASDGWDYEKQNDYINYIAQFRVDNTLLQKEGNHYFYNSADNAVNYSGRDHLFFVRNYTERTSMTAGINRDLQTKFSDFLPFSNTEGRVKGTMLTKDTQNINKYETYQMDATVDFDQYWFGMRMDFNFVQDKNGMLNNNEKMVFNFSGDDDVWVFIDDVLVLDLGGTHGKVTGSIDFASGKVKQYIDWIGSDSVGNGLTGKDSSYGEYKTEHSFPTTIYDCFEKAGRADSVLWKNSSSGNKIFSDYSQHKLSFFYLERGAGCANCSIDFALTTVSNDKAVAVTKEAYDSNNNRISADDTTEYEFQVTNSDGTSISNESERKYTIGSTEYTLGDDNIIKLKNGETALFGNWSNNGTYKIVEQSKDYIAKTESSISEISADVDRVSGDGRTVTVQPIDNGTKYVKFKNTIKSLDVTLKYYGRETVNGKPADIKKVPTTYTKSYIGQDYLKYVNSTEENIQKDPIGAMILDTSVTFDYATEQQDTKYRNVLDGYEMWISQEQAKSNIENKTNLHTDKKYTDVTYHTNWYGYTQDGNFWLDKDGNVTSENSDGEKWVNYYGYTDGNKQVLDESQRNSGTVTEVTVWLFNQPKKYTVTAYEAKETGTTFKNVGDKYVASGGNPKTIQAYYNQRLGLEIGADAEYSQATNHLKNYEINSYVGQKLDTAYSVKDSSGNTYKFAYWAFDPDGKNIASTDILYNYRIVTNTTLYAVYTPDGTVNDGKPGLTVSENERDIFFNSSGTSITRLNTEMNPYNCDNNDAKIKNVAITYIIPTSTNTEIVDVMPETQKQGVTYVLLKNVQDAIKKTLEYVSDENADKKFYSVTYSDQNISLEGIKKGNYFVFYVDGHNIHENELAGVKDISLTNKNRIEFGSDFQTKALYGDGDKISPKRMYAFAAMYYDGKYTDENNQKQTYGWIVSDNFIDYNFT